MNKLISTVISAIWPSLGLLLLKFKAKSHGHDHATFQAELEAPATIGNETESPPDMINDY